MALGSTIARLNVILGLDTGSFQTGSRKAQREAQTLQTRMTGMTKVIGGALAAMFTVDLAGRLGTLAADSLKFAASLGETATQLGVTTGELQEYRYVASQVGLEQEQMDKGLAKLSITLGKVAAGSKTETEALQRLGFTVDEIAELANMSAGQALPRLADAIGRIESPTRRAELAAKLFGDRLGPKFMSLLAEGSEGINGLRNAAHELGIVLSEEQIANADRTADKMDQLKMVLSARIAGVVSENAAAIYELADSLAQLASDAIKGMSEWQRVNRIMGQRYDARRAADNSLTSGENAGLSRSRREELREIAYREIDRRLGVRERSAGGIPGLFEFKNVEVQERHSGRITEALDRLSQAGRLMGNSVAGGFEEAGTAAERGGGRVTRATGAMKREIDEFAEMMERLFPERGNAAALEADLARIAGSALSETEQSEAVMRRWRQFLSGSPFGSGRGTEPDFSDAKPLTAGMDNVGAAIERLTEKAKTGTVKIARTFKDMADDTLQSLDRLTNAIKGGGFLDILGAVIGLGLQLGSMGVFGKTIAGRLNNTPGFASGTMSAPRGLAWVGERGPELVRFNGGERVHSNRESMGMAGGGRLVVEASPLFDVYLDGKLVEAAPPIARAGGHAGQAMSAFRASRSLA